MMREIKFRAWDGEKFGYFHFHPNKISEPERGFLDAINGRWHQYTGLKDKNGVEIYESDRLNCCVDGECSIHEVVWGGESDSGYPAFDLVPYVEVESNGISYFNAAGTIEVIGNIYEDGHLLEGKE